MAELSNSERIMCNIILVGNAGSGKSCFANYLFQTNRFTSGVGYPVPGWEKDFRVYTIDIDGVSVNVYEYISSGDEDDRWLPEILDDFLTDRERIAASDAIPRNSLMHTLFYVVHGARDAQGLAEANEGAEIRDICKKHELSLSVAITHCDAANEASILAIEEVAKAWKLKSIRICSNNANAKTRIGEDTRFGKEPAISQFLEANYAKIGRPISLSIISGTEMMMRAIQNEAPKKIHATNISVRRLSRVDEELAKVGLAIHNDYLRIYTEDILPHYYAYFHFLDSFQVGFKGREEFEDCILEIEDALSIVDMEHINLSDIVVRHTPDKLISNRNDMLKSVTSLILMYAHLRSSLEKSMFENLALCIVKLGKQIDLLNYEDYL